MSWATASGMAIAAPSQEPLLLSVMSRIQDATARLDKSCNAAGEIGNRIFGNLPQAPSGALQGGPPQDGMMSAVHAAVDALHDRLTLLDMAIQRLDQL